MSDPTMCALADITAAATRAVLWDGPPATYGGEALPVPPTPPFCAETARLARDAMARWSPSLHWLHHLEFRAAVHTVLLVSQRLDLQHGKARDHLRVSDQSAGVDLEFDVFQLNETTSPLTPPITTDAEIEGMDSRAFSMLVWQSATGPALPLLPPELWFCVCGWFLRRDWTGWDFSNIVAAK